MDTDDQTAAAANPYHPPNVDAGARDQRSRLGRMVHGGSPAWAVLALGVLVAWVFGMIAGSFVALDIWRTLYPDSKTVDMAAVRGVGLILCFGLFGLLQLRTPRFSASTAILALCGATLLGLCSSLAELFLTIWIYM